MKLSDVNVLPKNGTVVFVKDLWTKNVKILTDINALGALQNLTIPSHGCLIFSFNWTETKPQKIVENKIQNF